MTRCRYRIVVVFDIHFYFLNFLAGNTREMNEQVNILQGIWLENKWSLSELDYILTKIDQQDLHYNPAFFVGKEIFHVGHVKSSYMLGISKKSFVHCQNSVRSVFYKTGFY